MHIISDTPYHGTPLEVLAQTKEKAFGVDLSMGEYIEWLRANVERTSGNPIVLKSSEMSEQAAELLDIMVEFEMIERRD